MKLKRSTEAGLIIVVILFNIKNVSSEGIAQISA